MSSAEMYSHVVEAASSAPSMNWKDRVHAAARVLGLPFARAKAFYYREDRRITAEEMDRARARIQQFREQRLREQAELHIAWLNSTVEHLRANGEELAGFDVSGLERALARTGTPNGAVGHPRTDADETYDQREFGED